MDWNEKSISFKHSVLISIMTSFLVIVIFVGIVVSNRDNIIGWLDGSGSVRFAPELTREEARLVNVVERTNPAVVSIIVRREIPEVGRFGPFIFQIPNGGEERKVGGGSGFFISRDGLIITNKHVVSDESASYSVITYRGEEYEAEVVDRDPFNDLAVIRVRSNKSFPYLEFGNSSTLKLGQTVIAIGNSLGEFSNSVSVGVVSGLSRSIVAGDAFGRSEFIEDAVQTDAAIHPGNSGGPLIDLSGHVVGVNVAIARSTENIGFALPAELASHVADSVKEHGEIIRPFLGIRYIELTPAMAEIENLPASYGAYVIEGQSGQSAITPGSPAEEAGIREGDIITALNGEEIRDRGSLARIIRTKEVGQTVEVRFLRNETERVVNVNLGRMPR